MNVVGHSAENSPRGVPSKERYAMNISLLIGFLMLGIKWSAYTLTGSTAIFSDAMETIVHIAAVSFASFSIRLTYRPPDNNHHFGHEKISYLSAGIEGGLIILAAIIIFYEAIEKILHGITLERVGIGTALTMFAAAINTLLGVYLVHTGKRSNSVIITANGKHILTDAWTSLGAVVGLVAAKLSGVMIIDPIAALIFGGNIVYEGWKLMRNSVNGLMDTADPNYERLVLQTLDEYCKSNEISFHRLRMRETAGKIFIDFHIQFHDGTPIEKAHALATGAENAIAHALPIESDVFTHLESMSQPPNHI